MSNQLTFQNTTLTVVQRNNQTYISANDLANALLYADASAVNRIYTRHSDEFTADMTCSVNLTDPKMPQYEQRIFSLRGAHLIAMFARTPVAKDFRKWVLDILDKEVLQNSTEIVPLATKPRIKNKGLPTDKQWGWEIYQREFTTRELEFMVGLWYNAERVYHFVKPILPALETLQSELLKDKHVVSSLAQSLDFTLHTLSRIVEQTDVPRHAPLARLQKAMALEQARIGYR